MAPRFLEIVWHQRYREESSGGLEPDSENHDFREPWQSECNEENVAYDAFRSIEENACLFPTSSEESASQSGLDFVCAHHETRTYPTEPAPRFYPSVEQVSYFGGESKSFSCIVPECPNPVELMSFVIMQVP